MLLATIYFSRAVAIGLFVLFPVTEVSAYMFAAAMGLLWLSTVPLTAGLVSLFFGARYMGMLYGVAFFSHQLGSFVGVWLGGYVYDHTGSYSLVWYLGILLGLGSAAIAPADPRTQRPVLRPGRCRTRITFASITIVPGRVAIARHERSSYARWLLLRSSPSISHDQYCRLRRGTSPASNSLSLMAALMALNALAIDVMLPALPYMGEALGIANENERQFVVGAYMLGFGIAQLAFGPLTDRFGRRAPLFVGPRSSM